MSFFEVFKLIGGPALNAAESIYDSFRDRTHPILGSVVYCDLAFGYMEHSGIYIGSQQIAHLNSKGDIEVVSPKEFISGTTACFIYVSCKAEFPVGSHDAYERAVSMIGQSRNYNFILDNCHQFSAGCLDGNFEGANNFLSFLKLQSEKILGCDNWRYWDIELFD